MFALNVVILLACAVGAGIFHGSTGVRLPFMGNIVEEAAAAVAGVHILTYFILFTYLIPISLFVTIELVRLAQTKFMEWDEQMVSTDGKGEVCGFVVRFVCVCVGGERNGCWGVYEM